MTDRGILSGRVLVVAFEGWNDAGDAASTAARMLRDSLAGEAVANIDGEYYFDYQFTRPVITTDDDGARVLVWPTVSVFGPTGGGPDRPDEQLATGDVEKLYVLLGTEPSRSWKSFAEDIMDVVLAHDITAIVTLGAMLADVPHTRPISIFVTSESASARDELGIERSTYEGPVGILSVLADAAESDGIPTVSVWASVPHYVHNTPSPKATLALLQRLEELLGIHVPRGTLVEEAEAWELGIDQLASEDDDMAAYIEQLERARDTVDSPEASGDAIAEEFERYLKRRGDGRHEGGWADGRG